jgi:hypothetical protein
LCVWSDERDDVDGHTHDRAWFPWTSGKIARRVATCPMPDDAIAQLVTAVASAGTTGARTTTRTTTLFPALARLQRASTGRK